MIEKLSVSKEDIDLFLNEEDEDITPRKKNKRGRPRKNYKTESGIISLPTIPTKALPGTKAKIEILALRFALRQTLFHSQDAKISEKEEKLIRAKFKLYKEEYPSVKESDLMYKALEDVSMDLCRSEIKELRESNKENTGELNE